MSLLRQEWLKRRDGVGPEAGPDRIHLTVRAVAAERCGGYELRGEDGEGRIHYTFRDPCRLLVLDEFDATLGDLLAGYDPAP